jgi:hypothetical protein
VLSFVLSAVLQATWLITISLTRQIS